MSTTTKNAHRATSAALLSFALLAAPQTPTSPADRLTLCPNVLPHEPVLLYEVTGGTLSGPVDYFLSLYGDGSARLSSYLGDGVGSSQLGGVSPAEVEDLRDELIALGTLNLCDSDDVISDVPLSTLTVFRSGARPRSNTFSWFEGAEGVAEIQALLEAFIAAHFVPPPGGSGSWG